MKVRLIIAAIIVMVVLAVQAANTWMFGEGDLQVLAGNSALTLVVDDEIAVTIPAGATRRMQLAQGEHTLQMTSKDQSQTLTIDVGGWTDAVVAGPTYCVVEVDVTSALYSRTTTATGMPRVVRMHEDQTFADRPDVAGTTGENLPNSIEEGDKAILLVSVPCGTEQASEAMDAAIMEALMR